MKRSTTVTIAVLLLALSACEVFKDGPTAVAQLEATKGNSVWGKRQFCGGGGQSDRCAPMCAGCGQARSSGFTCTKKVIAARPMAWRPANISTPPASRMGTTARPNDTRAI